MQVHIRQYTLGNNGLYPTKKGIALNLEQWKRLDELYYNDVNENITACVNKKPVDYKVHLGSNMYVTVKSGYPVINIRKWFMPDGHSEVVPTRQGITLSANAWYYVRSAMDLVKHLLKEQIDNIVFCEASEDHQNQLGYLICANCNPNDFMNY
ncbi:hypothetical protein KUTeg_009261 [Tegillarca granosa]|uniref:Transcriptional coactivator p15 (PC4) C-terminal domain-containing protein n=1 Tax=Tegillarca granosa TaxID=220873 RepID=A0ABQ9FAD6_TEGGR|nr:hypothetical protein KUTeg_009261 [Tegillarca granosa]